MACSTVLISRLPAPDCFQQLRLGHHAVAVFHQILKSAQWLRGDVDLVGAPVQRPEV